MLRRIRKNWKNHNREKQIEVTNIVLNKRGFAFVDLQDNVALDKAIEKLSGMKINGKEISVEHSGSHFPALSFIQIWCNLSSTYISYTKSTNKKYTKFDELGRFGLTFIKIWKGRILWASLYRMRIGDCQRCICITTSLYYFWETNFTVI